MAQRGGMSRRAAEKLIAEGRVTVNGAPAAIGMQADGLTDVIAVDGVPLGDKPEKIYIMLNKPEGYVTTMSDDRGRRTVAELVKDAGQRVYPVGRLDIATRGLLLMTNDGELANRLTHPSFEKEKVYLAEVAGDIDACVPALEAMTELEGESISAPRVRIESRSYHGGTLEIIIHEGKNRQVRRMCQAVGLNVIKLMRSGESGLELGDLPEGKWRYLTAEEKEKILQ